MKTYFYPTDINYTVKDSKAIIQLFGRTKDGKRICAIDENFEPYFYITGSPDLKALEAIKQEDNKITRIEKTTKNLNEHETTAYKIYVNIPKAVPVIKDLAREIPKVTGVYEYDILFARRYLIDKQIIPLTLTEIEGEEIPAQTKVPCIKIKTIKAAGEETIKPRTLAVDIETYNPDNRIDTKKNPILMIGLYGENFSRVITWKKFATQEKYIEFTSSEADMIQRFCELVNEYAPDFITGYFTDGFDFPYIVDRAKKHKIKLDIGLDYTTLTILGKTQKEAKITGIAHIDLFKFVRKVIARSLKTDTYTLNAVAGELIGEQKHDVDMERLFSAWDEGSNELDLYAKYNWQDCALTYKLFEKLLPNLIEFVRIIRLPPYDINRMTFSTFVEWYLINKASAQNEIILNRPGKREETQRMQDRIKGAFVYEPTPGLYKNIAVFDFRSLYPSIIASLNISKGTLNCKCCPKAPRIKTERGEIWYCQKQKGLFSTVIEELITRRAEIKKQIKTDKSTLLAARSEALKVLANSFYGYMGFAPARYYCIECAESTTAWARHYIQQTIDNAKKHGFTVLYSDTDSVFLLLDKKTDSDALKFMEETNEKLPGMMELDYEGHYLSGIFVGTKTGEGGAKKKYALLCEKGDIKIRGFETVRRNSSFIAKETQQKILEIILKEHDADKAKKHVKKIIDELRTNKIPLDKVIIHTALSKGTESYAAIGPHVAAAQRMEERGQKVGAGSIIKYVVIKGKGKIRDKVKLPDEIKQEDYDGEYYIKNQVIPGVEKIFEVLNIKLDELSSETKQKSLDSF